MNASTELLDAYKKATGATSDNAAALQLGLTRAAVSSWRTELKHPGMAAVEKMANAIQENPAKWALKIAAERAQSIDDRKAWLRCAQRVAVVALTLGTLAAPTLLHAANSCGLPIVSNYE